MPELPVWVSSVESEQLEDVEGVFFAVALEFHLEAEVGIAVQPASLVDILWPHRNEPVLTVAHVRAKLHDHVRKLVEIGTGAEVLHRFILEYADFLWGEPVHLDHLQGLPVELEWELELFKLPEPLVKTNQSLHVFLTLVTLVLLQQFQVVVHLVDVQPAVWTQ